MDLWRVIVIPLSFFRNYYLSYSEDIIEGDDVMSLWTVIGRILKVLKQDEYQAVVETERGVRFTISVTASSESDAEDKIKEDIVDSCTILEIRRIG